MLKVLMNANASCSQQILFSLCLKIIKLIGIMKATEKEKYRRVRSVLSSFWIILYSQSHSVNNYDLTWTNCWYLTVIFFDCSEP